jgi:hypothetical protein
MILIVSPVLGVLTGSGSAASDSAIAAPDEPPFQGEPMTPLQTELAEAISQRHAAGLPIPDVTFNTKSADIQSFSTPSLPQAQAMVGETITTATTNIYFDGPQEAGYGEWPALEISGNLAGDEGNSFATGDLTEVFRTGVEEQIPDFWQQVEFGQEARKYSITETYELSPAADASRPAMSLLDSTQVTTTGDILMGFTYTGPHIDYTIEYQATICLPGWLGGGCADLFYLKAGFELDWALGLRLPASVTLTGTDQVEQGSDAYFETSLTPQDWVASQYENYGVAGEDGNEFVLSFAFFAGLKLELLGADMCPPGIICYVDFDEDGSESFTTPFGTGSFFPIPSLDIPIFELDLAVFKFSTSLTITPLLTSTQIMADWNTVPGSDCSGSGSVTYTEPDTPVPFGPVSVCNLDQDPETNQAQVELDNFRYYFNSFQIQLGAKVEVDVFGVYENTIEGTIFTLDLSQIFSSLELYVGDHVQCTWDFNCSRAGPANSLILTSTTVDETPPVTSIALTGNEGNNGWYVSDVQVSLSAEDECGSGVEMTEYSFDNANWTSYTGEVTLADEGTNTVYYRSKDFDGNEEAAKSQIIHIDKTPPDITGAPTTAPNSFGWWNTDVVVHFDASDAASGVDFVTPDITISSEGANQTVTGTAVDIAGNDAQVTVTDINIDKTPPVVTITSPLPQTYANIESFEILWTAQDTLSGINTVNGEMDGAAVSYGQLVELRLVAAGEHTITVFALDKADNVTTVSTDFFVTVDIDGLIASVEYMCQEGWINSPGICTSYLAKLYNAEKAIDRGQCHVAENVLNAFIKELKALSGIGLTVEAANVSKTNALYVIEDLTCASP